MILQSFHTYLTQSQPVESGRTPPFSIQDTAILLFIICAAFICYLPSSKGGFILNWDDNKYVVENAAAHGFSMINLGAAFSNIYVGNYAPLHIISYMLDYTLWGLNPVGYHAANIMLHAANGALFYYLLRTLAWIRLPALLAALLFVLHPVQAESVAWISQRKNLLSMFLALISFIFYIKAQTGGQHGRKAYAISLVAFVLALLTKSVTVFIPLVFILHDICFSDRDRSGIIRSVVPFLALSAGCAYLTYLTQHEARTGWHGGTPSATFFTMMPVFVEYLRMLVWPTKLSALYDPVLRHSLVEPAVAASVVLLAGIFCAAVVISRKRPREMFWFWFSILSLAPVSQLVPLTTLMNDRYLYYPVMGFAALVFGFLTPVIVHSTAKKQIISYSSLVILLILAIMSGQRTLVWKDSFTLWSDAVTKAPGSRFAHQGLAEALERQGDLVGASEQYLVALSRDSGSAELNSQAGVVFAQLRQFPRAIFFLTSAVNLRPAADTYRMNLASALLEYGSFSGAIEQLKVIDGRAPSTRNSCTLGALYEKIGDLSAAAIYYSRVGMGIKTTVPAECTAIRTILGLARE